MIIIIIYFNSLFLVDKLPKGAYCSFNNDDKCGWYLAENKNTGQNVTLLDGKLLIKITSKMQLGNSFFLKSPQFSSIPYYHSQKSSSYYTSCRVCVN